jgi:hypothetical protein
MRQQTSAYASIRQHTPAYVSIKKKHAQKKTLLDLAASAEKDNAHHPHRHRNHVRLM